MDLGKEKIMKTIPENKLKLIEEHLNYYKNNISDYDKICSMTKETFCKFYKIEEEFYWVHLSSILNEAVKHALEGFSEIEKLVKK